MKSEKKSIGVFAGSFNPFHIGHLNVWQQAKPLFDEVIVAVGNNAEKVKRQFTMPTYLQVEYYDGLLVDYLRTIPHDVTLIRGLRNGDDLQYEINLRSTLRDFDKDINVIYLLCDAKYSHVSSSMIRDLQRFDKGWEYMV